MHYDELVQLFHRWNVPLISKDSQRIRGYTVDEFRVLAKLTERIDYDCAFENGACRGRECGEPGCCWRCADTFGHWLKEEGPLDEDTVRQIAGFYDPATGFCRANGGCVIPRELRSPTCLFIYCSDAQMSGADLDLLWRIRDGKSLTTG